MAVDKLVDSTQLDADLTSVANAIRTKGGTSAQLSFPSGFISAVNAIPTGGGGTTLIAKTITQNGTYNASDDSVDGYSSVSVNVSGVNTSAELSDVNFYDYDGTLLHSYTAAEALELTALPENPSHSGLTAQGWNYTLSQIKAEVTDHGACDIGQTYITDDGKTRIYIHLESGGLHPYLGICPNGTVIIDWGDNSATNTLTGTSLSTVKVANHEYANSGDYIISLTVSSGSFAFYGSTNTSYILRRDSSTSANIHRVYSSAVQKIYIGANVSIKDHAFKYCYSLTNITIPNGVTTIGSYAFYYCTNLKSIVIPNGVTSIGLNTFNYCTNLKSIIIPNGITTIGTYLLYQCNTLERIVIPNGVTTIGSYAFNYCQSLVNILMPNSVTTITENAFSYCCALQSIVIPNSVTTIGVNAFTGCWAFRNVIIPDSVTSIGDNAFNNCHCLTNIIISSAITSIASNTFSSCYGLGEIHFRSTTPPTLSSSSTFISVQSNCVFYVPVGTLSAYTSASNYPNASTYTYIEE